MVEASYDLGHGKTSTLFRVAFEYGQTSCAACAIASAMSRGVTETNLQDLNEDGSARARSMSTSQTITFGALGGKVTPYEEGKEVLAGLTAIATPGHSVGHASFVLSSGASSVFIQGDVAHIPVLFVANPGWHASIDQDPVMAEATRRKVYDMLVAEKMLVQGFHYPFPALAHVEKTASGYREVLMPWNPNI